jgi:hypothetical protein
VSDSIPQDLVDKMMVKCARRCCICRRFRPTKLQVHHIVERNQGGTNDEDNLIVTCMACHTDVHSKVPFSRRFSSEELKGHRDALVKMVEQGVLPADDRDDADEAMAEVVRALRAAPKTEVALMPEAAELLVAAVGCKSNRQGIVFASMMNSGLRLGAGERYNFFTPGDRRAEANYKHALEQLLTCGLVERESASMLWVTHSGYLAADEIMVGQASP